MKRRLFQTILSFTLIFCVVGANVSAATLAENTNASQNGTVIKETIEYLSNGDYIVTTIVDETPITPYATTFTKTGSKTHTRRNADGDILFQFTIHGTFSVNSGVSATCTAASYSINIVEDAWQNETASASRSANKAIGDAKFIRKLLFVTVDSATIQVILTCDSNGNLS